jgi:hypothetical protein
MATPHYLSEDKSEMRGIKCGWYAIEEDGALASGPYPSREECVLQTTPVVNSASH